MADYEPYVGSIDFTAFPYAIKNWAFAWGQLVPISQNNALFALVGTYYGGDGRTTFALPDLRGRAPVGQGAGPGLEQRDVGEEYGTEVVTLTLDQLPAHEHPVQLGSGSPVPGGQSAPAAAASGGGAMAPTGIAGRNAPVPIMPPSLVLSPQIALYGVFPPRQ